jgi:putative nucleotidyltransferase with HDIG domain
MLKRIPVERLTSGMFVQEFCGSWMDHPFWRAKFLLNDPADLKRIRDSGIKEIWIDTSKGKDLPDGGETQEEVREQVERELEFVASRPMEWLDQPTTFADEVNRARALCKRSKQQLSSMFAEARLGKALEIEGCVSLVEEISESVMRNSSALISVARLKMRDEYTYMHSMAVCALMIALARQLNLDANLTREAGLAGLLHDMGKALVPLEILNKPGKLTDNEFAVMKSHPARGAVLLQKMKGVTAAAIDVCLHHHERVDGGGYPHKLAGDKLSLLAKMGAVCDVYDAITSNRPYKSGWDPAESLRQMAQWKGHFDPAVFQAFVKTVGIYPVGSLVRLKSGRLAVVTSQNPDALLKPKVKAFFSTKSNQRIIPEDVDLNSPWTQDGVAGCESPSDWPFKDLDTLWQPAVQ